MLEVVCEHKNILCKLVYTVTSSSRVDVCKDCNQPGICSHFKVQKSTMSYSRFKTRKPVETVLPIDENELDSLI